MDQGYQDTTLTQQRVEATHTQLRYTGAVNQHSIQNQYIHVGVIDYIVFFYFITEKKKIN